MVVATDLHIVVTPAGTAVSLPHPFTGRLDGGLSTTVRVEGRPAATYGSTATNEPPHAPATGAFQRPPANLGTVSQGSATVRINGRPAARIGDEVLTCNDPADLPIGLITGAASVRIG
jgi:uncharacterized Zn-binding protein involved in type VI secretion